MKADHNTITPFGVKVMSKYKVLSKGERGMIKDVLHQIWFCTMGKKLHLSNKQNKNNCSNVCSDTTGSPLLRKYEMVHPKIPEFGTWKTIRHCCESWSYQYKDVIVFLLIKNH